MDVNFLEKRKLLLERLGVRDANYEHRMPGDRAVAMCWLLPGLLSGPG